MVVERNNPKEKVRFDCVAPGTVVEYEDNLLLKIQEDTDTNAVDIKNGELWQLENCDMVYVPNAKLVIM